MTCRRTLHSARPLSVSLKFLCPCCLCFQPLAQGTGLNPGAGMGQDCNLSHVKALLASDKVGSPRVSPTETPHPNPTLPKHTYSHPVPPTQQSPPHFPLVAKYPSPSPPPHLPASRQYLVARHSPGLRPFYFQFLGSHSPGPQPQLGKRAWGVSSKLPPRDFKSDRLPESPEMGKKACFESFRRGTAHGTRQEGTDSNRCGYWSEFRPHTSSLCSHECRL